MAQGKNQRLRFKRRRNGQTDYRRRMKLLRGGNLRAVVRISNTQVICQLIEFGMDGDNIFDSISGQTLVDKYKWPKNISRKSCLLYTSPSPRDATLSRMPSSA